MGREDVAEARELLEEAVKLAEKDHRSAIREIAATLLAVERGVETPDPAVLGNRIDVLREVADDAESPVEDLVAEAIEGLEAYRAALDAG